MIDPLAIARVVLEETTPYTDEELRGDCAHVVHIDGLPDTLPIEESDDPRGFWEDDIRG